MEISAVATAHTQGAAIGNLARAQGGASSLTMRVFYDHQVTSLQDAGGVSRYFYELIQSLRRIDGVKPDIGLGLERSVLPFRDLPRPVRVWSTVTALRPGYQRYAINEAITALTAPFHGRYDVYHSTYQRMLPYVRRKALVVTHHDSTPERFPHLFPDAASIRARLEKLYRTADRVLCISEASRQDLLEFHKVDIARTEVIHHGFTPLPEPGGLDGAEMALDGRPYLLYVGARSAYKNFPLVLEALAQQKDKCLCLLLVGGGDITAAEQVEIERLRLATRIVTVPRATDAQLAAAYESARMFVYPSLHEGFGFPPLEAMHAGCPVLVSRASALPEICGEAAFYFDPTSPEELADWIQRLHGDGVLRMSKRQAGWQHVRQYTWEKAAAATLDAYKRVSG